MHHLYSLLFFVVTVRGQSPVGVVRDCPEDTVPVPESSTAERSYEPGEDKPDQYFDLQPYYVTNVVCCHVYVFACCNRYPCDGS